MGRREEQQKRVGRVILLFIYVIYCGLYYLALQSAPDGTHEQVLGAVILTMIWTTVLFGALCMNQRWARYVFLGLTAFSIVLLIPFLWEIMSKSMRPPDIVWGLLGFHVLVLAVLSYSTHVKALGKR